MSGGNSRGADAGSDDASGAKDGTPPPADAQAGQNMQGDKAGQPHNIMADVIARHEAAIYRLKK